MNLRPLTVLLVLGSAACAHHPAPPPHWGYEGATGPHAWGTLSPEYAACGIGQHQSPVDLHGHVATPLPPLVFRYQPTPLNQTHTGHTVQQTFAPGSTLEIGGEPHDLVQLHFHAPSEHTVAGRRLPLELHLVHRSEQGRIAVVGILYEEQSADDGALDVLLGNLPREKGETRTGDATVDPARLLPPDRAYLSYPGSLTTPPCTEGVRWQVFHQVSALSTANLRAWLNVFPANSRPVMPLSARRLESSR